jgi:hypothetical protein
MRRDELQLRRIVQSLARLQGTPGVAAARHRALHALACKLAEMQALVEDCLSGRTRYEQSVMEYRIRVEFPVYSHLGALAALDPEHWSSSAPDRQFLNILAAPEYNLKIDSVRTL